MKPFQYLLAVSLIAFPIATHAAQVSELVKGSSSAVYAVIEGKRYAFLNEAVYKSWYSDFKNVATIKDSDLANYPLTGIMSFRPGTALVKMPSDPKVYAVGQYNTLRYLASEDVAKSLYGASWAKVVRDVPESFFAAHYIGTPVSTSTDFLPEAETNRVTRPLFNAKTNTPIIMITDTQENNFITIHVHSPVGEKVGKTTIVDGKFSTDKSIAACQEDCDLTMQINVPGFFTAFTAIGDQMVGSNTIEVTPTK